MCTWHKVFLQLSYKLHLLKHSYTSLIKPLFNPNHLTIQVMWNTAVLNRKKTCEKCNHSLSQISLVLPFLSEYFPSRVHWEPVHARTFCRKLKEKVTESFPTKTEEEKKKKGVQEPLSVSVLFWLIFSQTTLSNIFQTIEFFKICSCYL